MRAMVPTAMRPRGGPSALPSWVSEAVAGRWGVVPVAAALSTLDPKLNASLNPNHPASPEWYGNTGFGAIVTTWCGGCFDEVGDVFWLPLQGGHQDYGGNDPWKLLLNQEIPTWAMVRPPSGAIGNLLTTNDGQEATGVYSDGRMRAIHSYNKPVYVPGLGPVIAAQGTTYFSAAAGTTKPIFIDPDTGEGTFGAANSLLNGALSGAGTAFDPTRGDEGSIWVRGVGTGRFHLYDIATDTWTQNIGASSSSSGYASLAYMPEHDCLLWSDTNGLRVFDCATSTIYTPTFSGSPAADWSGCQLRWASGKAYTWNNASSTTLVTRITPGADPRTDTWTVDTLSVDGGNATTPTAKTTNGTYGRFWYSPNLGLFFVFNSVSGSIYFFKPTSAL